jgi:hypothetical protein
VEAAPIVTAVTRRVNTAPTVADPFAEFMEDMKSLGAVEGE